MSRVVKFGAHHPFKGSGFGLLSGSDLGLSGRNLGFVGPGV